MAKWWETLGTGLPELGTSLAWGRGARRERREAGAEKKKKEAEAKTAKDLDLEYLLHGTVGGVKPFADVRAEKEAETKAAYPTALVDNPFYREKAPGEREAWLAGLTRGNAPGGFTTETPKVPREILPYTAKSEPQTMEDRLALLLAGINARTEGQIKVKGTGRTGGGGPGALKDLTPQEQRIVGGAAQMLSANAIESKVIDFINQNKANYGARTDTNYLLTRARGILQKTKKPGGTKPDLNNPYGTAGPGQTVVKFNETPNYFAP